MSTVATFPDPDLQAQLAFIRALGEVQKITKSNIADTGKYTYKFVDLGDVMDECERACKLHDLVFTQTPTVIDGYLAVHLEFLHSSGGSYAREPLMMQLPKEAQAYGSALTYARRYQLLTVFRIAPEDDDGRTATVAEQTQPGRRTEAERLIREYIAGLGDPTERGLFIADFKAQFGVGLTDLPTPRHGDALSWTKAWKPPETTAEDAADAEWRAQARAPEEAPT